MLSKQYLKQVVSYIRSKEARKFVEEEVQYHLNEATQAWIQKGYSAKEAEQKAITEMGSPIKLGKSMDKIHKPKWDFWLIGGVLLLLAVGFIPLLTTDFSQFLNANINFTEHFVQSKLIHVLLAIGVMIALLFFDYRKIERFSFLFYGFAIFLLCILLFMPNAMTYGEAMYEIGFIRIQAWTVLPFLLIAFAGFFTNPKVKVWQQIGLFLIPLYFFMVIPNLPVSLFYTLVILVLFGFSVYSRKTKVIVYSVVVGVIGAFSGFMLYTYNYLLAPYQTARLQAFLHPELFAQNEGYLLLRLQEALAGARLLGAETPIYIPQAHTDYALVQLIQTYGFIAGGLVVALMLSIALRILWHARTMPVTFGKLLVIAAVALYSCQSIYSIFMVFGILPIISVPLPFISYGLTPLLLNAILIGFVLSVYRRKGFMTGHKLSAS